MKQTDCYLLNTEDVPLINLSAIVEGAGTIARDRAGQPSLVS